MNTASAPQKPHASSSSSTLRIEYVSWGGHAKDARHRWCAVVNATGEVWDYGSLQSLKKQAQGERVSYEVIRHHRNGERSVIEWWIPEKAPSVESGNANHLAAQDIPNQV